MIFLLVSNKTLGKGESLQQQIKFKQTFDMCNQLPFSQEDCQKLLTLIQSQPIDTNNINHQAANVISNSKSNSIISFHSSFSSCTMVPTLVFDNSWIINIRAIDHIIHSSDMFASITKFLHTLVKLSNGDTVPVSHLGRDRISRNLLLKNILCALSFCIQLAISQ